MAAWRSEACIGNSQCGFLPVDRGSPTRAWAVTDISILVVTYNRSEILVDTIANLKRTIASHPLVREIVIADDCSDSNHREVIDGIEGVRVVRTERNRGLGANANNGLDHCVGSLILQIQDDWVMDGDPAKLGSVCDFLERNPDVGIVQLSPIRIDLPVEYRECGDSRYHVFPNDHVPWMRRCNLRPYSDNPHLKRREFVSTVGPYLEDVPMTVCEAEYQRRVANQSRWKVAMLEGSLFSHVGEEASLNPGGRRHPLVKFLWSIPFGKTWLEPRLRALVYWADHVAARWMAR